MTDSFYLLDNNALSKLSPAQRRSVFVDEWCRIPSEVLWEARGYLSPGQLDHLEYPTTASVLEAVREVLATIPHGDAKLVDLYRNRGNADPLIVACALVATREEAQYLYGLDWVIVTDDLAVGRVAAEFGIPVWDSGQFQRVLDGANDQYTTR